MLGMLWRSLTKRTKKNSDENRAFRGGMVALLRDRIIQAYNYYMDKGYFPIYARENVTGMHEQYKKLGGNGVITGLITDLMKLPTDKKHAQPKGEMI